MRGLWGVAAVGALAMTATAHAANAKREPFGKLAPESRVLRFKLGDANLRHRSPSPI